MKKDLKFLAVLRSQDKAERLRTAVDGVDGIDCDIQVSEFGRVGPEIVNSHIPNVLLADISFDSPEELEELSRIVRDAPSGTAIIATAEQADFEGIRHLMRMGIADFIPQPMSEVDVRSALNVAVNKLSQPGRGHTGKVISFLRSCGGVGATTLAVQTAASLAGIGRKTSRRVCLVDFDLQYGNIALSLDMPDNVGIRQILESPTRLDTDFLLGSIGRHPSGLDVLAAPDRIVPLDAMTGDTAYDVVRLAQSVYDCVVIDMPRCWTSWTSYVLGASDLIVLVTELNVTAVQRCQQHIDLIAEQELDDVPIVVLGNRFRGGFSAKTRRSQAEKALGRKFDGLVRMDADTAAAARDRGVLLRDVKRRSVIEKDVESFVGQIEERVFVENKISVRSAA